VVGEIERLHIQSAAMVPDTERMLELIGVREGWSCLDIGCGPGGIVGLLCKRVGSTGRVVGLEMNIGFLEHARATAPSNVEFMVADAYGSNLPAGTFDLVHMRFVASTSRSAGAAIARSQASRAAGRHDRFAGSRYRNS
jgi:ubiquinone/menaquinone biosynthesis C-methylase UbiE